VAETLETVTFDQLRAESDALLQEALAHMLAGRHKTGIGVYGNAFQSLSLGATLLTSERDALLAERDALAAELATVKAALPRWRKDDDGVAYRLTVGPIERWVEPCGDGMWRAPYIGTTRYSRADAMLAVTEALGLPPCEVCDE